MVTVPTITGRSVIEERGPLGLADPNAPIGAFGGASAGAAVTLGGQTVQVGEATFNAAMLQQEEDDKREAKKLDIEYGSFLRTLEQGDGTEQNQGFGALRGENTVNAFPAYQSAIAEKRKDLFQSASNDRVKEIFSGSSGVRSEKALSRGLTKVETERRSANDAVSAARQTEAEQDTAVAPLDPDILERSLVIAATEAAETAARNGVIDPNTIASAVEEAKTRVLIANITAASELSNQGAREIFEKFKDQMDGTAHTKINSLLDAADREIVSRQEREERAQGRRLKEKQEAGYVNTLVELANSKDFANPLHGTVTEQSLLAKLQAGDLSSTDYIKSLNMLRKPDVVVSDPDTFINLRLDILKGEQTFQGIMETANISDKDQKELVDLQDVVERRGSVLARDNVKKAQEHIERFVAGEKGPLAKFDTVVGARLANALEEFNQRVVDGENVEEAKADVVRRYAPESMLDPREQILTLPRPTYWTGNRAGGKKLLMERHQKAIVGTMAAQGLSQGALKRELKTLQQFRDVIERMPD